MPPRYFDDQAARLVPETYAEFEAVLDRDIDHVISWCTCHRHILNSPTRTAGEDDLTLHFTGQLRQLGYDAMHGGIVGGNTDICVQDKSERFRWLGECKIHSSITSATEGYLQLTTRYSSGTVCEQAGGLILYFTKQMDVVVAMGKWLARLSSDDIEGVTTIQASAVDALNLVSENQHPTVGTGFRVRHMAVTLHHDPKDKSARSRKSTL